jgi:hypothetical protein
MNELPYTGNDAEVVAMLRKHEFRGHVWDRYAEYLAEYGMNTFVPLIASKKIFAEMRQKKIQCRGPVVIDHEDAVDLARMVVALAIEPHRQMLKNDEWDPTGPASLGTAFRNGCLHRFPNVYRVWLREKYGKDLEKVQVLPGDDVVASRAEERARNDPVQGLVHGDPEAILISREVRAELLALLPDNLRAAVQLVEQGFSFTDAAKALGEDPKKLQRRLDKIRPSLRRRWDDRRKETDS